MRSDDGVEMTSTFLGGKEVKVKSDLFSGKEHIDIDGKKWYVVGTKEKHGVFGSTTEYEVERPAGCLGFGSRKRYVSKQSGEVRKPGMFES